MGLFGVLKETRFVTTLAVVNVKFVVDHEANLHKIIRYLLVLPL